MWWPLRRRWRGRHSAGRVVFIGASGIVEPWAAADVAVIQAAADVLAEAPFARAVETSPSPTPVVSFGFADGSTVDLADDHPAAAALKAAADRLTATRD